jgi:hypothetical protein
VARDLIRQCYHLIFRLLRLLKISLLCQARKLFGTYISVRRELAVLQACFEEIQYLYSSRFRPSPRFKHSDTTSDAGSIRSNRSAMSAAQLHNIRSGAYRISRIPKEVVGTKTDIAASLKPTWDVRHQGARPTIELYFLLSNLNIDSFGCTSDDGVLECTNRDRCANPTHVMVRRVSGNDQSQLPLSPSADHFPSDILLLSRGLGYMFCPWQMPVNLNCQP